MVEKTNEKIYQTQVIIHEYDQVGMAGPDFHVIEIWTVQGQMIAKTEIKKQDEKQ